MRDVADALTAAIEAAADGLVLVVTGAGVSRASGIATFRGPEPEAVWKQSDFEMATEAFFERDPVAQWRWYVERFRAVEGAAPNAAHRALARLEAERRRRGAGFTLVTQNIDTLHEQAGSRRPIKIHGSSDRLRCARRGCVHGAPRGSLPRRPEHLAPFLDRPARDTLPTCPACGGLLRAHVLFFDEYYQDHEDYRFEAALAAGAEARLMLFVGTSFSVGITDLLLRTAWARATPVLAIDPHASPTRLPPGLRLLAAPAEELLPEVARRLRV